MMIISTIKPPNMTKEFKLIGLSKPRSATLALIDNVDVTFNAKVDMTLYAFNELFNYCKNHWQEEKFAKVEFESITEDGIPINPVVVKIQTLL